MRGVITAVKRRQAYSDGFGRTHRIPRFGYRVLLLIVLQ
jgi:hypothetical protein